MSDISLQSIGHVYPPATRALQPLDVTFEEGGAYALLGPSGCGKTTLLSIISGLLPPTEGTVRFGERDVSPLPPERRNIAQVFQFPVVYDTMTVRENLAFPLRNQGLDAATTTRRVAHIAELLELGDVLSEKARSLGADTRQRISLGRGLVREDVQAVLLDEPLTVIDPQARWQLRRRLKALHDQLAVTWIYVTHDQEEALTFADQVLVMNEGEIVQQGSPQELFERPAHRFVGHFIGSPGMSFIPCTPIEGGVRIGEQTLELPANQRPEGDQLELGIRPEHVRLSGNGPALTGELVDRQDRGSYRLLTVGIGDHRLHVRTQADEPAPVGARLEVVLPGDRIHFYRNGRRVGP